MTIRADGEYSRELISFLNCKTHKKKTMTKEEKIEEFLGSLRTEIDVLYHVNADEVESYQDVYDQIESGGGFDADVIYYSNAMDYLSEKDASLQESLEIASEMG
jgi:hypothetical protein